MDARDAIIVGGGPAGSTLARRLTGAGLRVVVLDSRRFPRDKVCAGWITPAVVRMLGLDLGEYARSRVLQPIRGFEIGTLGRCGVRHLREDVVSYGIRRVEFDHYLLERCGAEVRDGVAVKSIRREGGTWVVNDTLRAPLLVGAGGHFCPVARTLGADLGRTETVVGAQEFEVRLRRGEQTGVRGDTPRLYFCTDLAGYGWVFRKGDWVNVGIGRENPEHLADHVARFVHGLVRNGVLPASLGKAHPRGHAYLLYTHAARPLVAEGAVLVGDAAGVAYPESGEGIRPAIESALLAAQVIQAQGCAGDLSAYARAVEARFGARRWRQGMRVSAPGPLRQRLAGWLLATRWFTRDVVARRWFLHEQVPPLAATD